ncbi:hypothetical protein ABZ770_16555 [Streptomyces sp. NPDC006654]|uniref:hypothetical protein n=1 Tax=Streptomyces sp. NPDC006654 TaxID=3156897 RepID=UPI003402FC10
MRITLGAMVLEGLEDAERGSVAGHLSVCGACAQEYAELRLLLPYLRAVPPEEWVEPNAWEDGDILPSGRILDPGRAIMQVLAEEFPHKNPDSGNN